MISVLVTGWTGSIWGIIVNMLLNDPLVHRVVSLSRKEMFISYQKTKVGNNPKVEYYCGDILDYNMVQSLVAQVDLVIHTAASKFVDVSEDNVWSTINNNIIGSNNVLLACQTHKKDCILTSTDKACNPETVMWATKYLMEKLAFDYAKRNPLLNIRVARFGNVFGSYGSVIHKFIGLTKRWEICPVTDFDMTRFIITREEVAEVFSYLMYKAKSWDLASYNMKAIDMSSIIWAFTKRDPNFKFVMVGRREAEKDDEQIFTDDELRMVVNVWNVTVYNKENQYSLDWFSNDSALAPKYTVDEIVWLISDAETRMYWGGRN